MRRLVSPLALFLAASLALGCAAPAPLAPAPVWAPAPAAQVQPTVTLVGTPPAATRPFAAPTPGKNAAAVQALAEPTKVGWGYAFQTLWKWATGPFRRGPVVDHAPARGSAYAPDRFMFGANLPWVGYGSDFGANAWQPDGGVSRPEARAALDAALARLEAAGVKHVRWFMFCDGRAGLRFAIDGTPLGLDAHVFADVDAAVASAKAHHLRLTFSLVDFYWFKPGETVSGVSLRGHADVARDPAKRRAFVQQMLVPLLDRYGQEPAIAAWDIVNEPEWITYGVGAWTPRESIAPTELRAFVADCVTAVHAHATQPATVGSASTMWLGLVRELGLDFYQAHWYDHFESRAPLARPVADLKLDRPLVLGEYPTKGSAKSARQIVEAVRGAGYGGALAWGLLSTDESSDFGAAEPGLAAWAADHREALAP